MDWLRTRPLAHRGLHDVLLGRPENTMPAFEAAREADVGVELDVMLTADHEVVVVHDDDLDRLTGRKLRVSQSAWQELRRVPVLRTEHTIPRLAEVLEAVGGRIPVMVEVKNPRASVGRLEAAVRRIVAPFDDDVAVASFNPRTVQWFARNAPRLLRGQAAGRLRDVPVPWPVKAYLRSLVSNHWTRPHFVSFELAGLPHQAASRWRRRGLPLITWTVRGEADLHKARSVADNLIFEGIAVERVRQRP